jgi:hypothetical protein
VKPDARVFQEVVMVLKNVFTAVVCTMLLAWNCIAVADEYRPDELLGLDLSNAVLSPRRLGPPAEFAPLAIEAKTDGGSVLARTEHVVQPKVHVVQPRSEKPHAGTHVGLARRHTNPLDAQAFDARIQVWPCRSGGICGWKR